MDEFRNIILDALNETPEDWRQYVPSQSMAMGEWHETVARIVDTIRDDFENPEFAFSTGAVRSCYNRPLDELARLIDHQLRFREADVNDTVIAL